MQKVLFIQTEYLGLKHFNHAIAEVLHGLPEVAVDIVTYGPTSPEAPVWSRNSSALRVRHRLLRQLEASGIDPAAYDTLFLTSHQFLWPMQRWLRDRRVVLFLDATPRHMHRASLLRKPSLAYQVRSLLADGFDRLRGRALYRQVDCFLPVISQVQESLVDEYQVPPERIRLLRPRLQATPHKRVPGKLLKLLFIGNDFLRKGGDFLFRMYQEHLQATCTLTIISKAVPTDTTVPGVTIVQEVLHKEIFALMHEHDLFLFPTRLDASGFVLFEALSCGLPIISADALGQRDMVLDGDTGYLMPYDAAPSAWVERICFLHRNRETLRAMAERSFEVAQTMFVQGYFAHRIAEAVGVQATPKPHQFKETTQG